VGEAWQYSLPTVVDPQDSDITITVELAGAAIFVDYLDFKLSIKKGKTT
jgi:hypothetical protein